VLAEVASRACRRNDTGLEITRVLTRWGRQICIHMHGPDWTGLALAGLDVVPPSPSGRKRRGVGLDVHNNTGEVIHTYVCRHACLYVCTTRGSSPRCRRHADGNTRTAEIVPRSCRDRAEDRAEIVPRIVPRSRPRVGRLIVKMLMGSQRDATYGQLMVYICGVHMRCRVPTYAYTYGSRLGRLRGYVVCGMVTSS